MPQIDMQKAREAINTIRLLAADMVEKAQSGHPGTPMEAAPIAYLLDGRHMRHNPPIPSGPAAIASSSPAATPRRCSTACCT